MSTHTTMSSHVTSAAVSAKSVGVGSQRMTFGCWRRIASSPRAQLALQAHQLPAGAAKQRRETHERHRAAALSNRGNAAAKFDLVMPPDMPWRHGRRSIHRFAAPDASPANLESGIGIGKEAARHRRKLSRISPGVERRVVTAFSFLSCDPPHIATSRNRVTGTVMIFAVGRPVWGNCRAPRRDVTARLFWRLLRLPSS